MKKHIKIVAEDGEQYEVDAAYIKKALDGLKQIKSSNKSVYDAAVRYLNSNKGRYLVVSPEQFIARRLALAAQSGASTEPVDNRTPEQRTADATKAAAERWKSQLNPDKDDTQVIKSIWVKSLDDDKAVLQIAYANGNTETVEVDAATDEQDRFFKQMAQLIRACHRTMKSDYIPVNKRDVQLAMICAPYNDPRIEWFFGKNKKPKTAWKYGIVILDKHRRELEQYKKMMAKKAKNA